MQLVVTPEPIMSEQTNTAPPRIKKERQDEREIDQLALEMAEKNRQKMISQAAQIAQQTQASQQALQRAGGQQMITYYFNRDKDENEANSDSIGPKKVEEKKKNIVDEDSQKGRFGWSTIHTVDIPYLFRREDKYCAVRMVETKLLNKYLSYLPQEITTCIHVRSYFITEHEAKLLNEINMRHCEFQFGRDLFTTKDLVVRLKDARCFYKFLDTCFKKLVQKSHEQSEFCGFVRINGESVVPYTVKEKVKYVPLFYFEGETDTLKLKAEKIDNWELAYLKFCCKVQGIRNELFASDTCSVVSLEDVQQYFPSNTQFEDWWPQKTAEPMKVATASHGTKPGGMWTQRPPNVPSQTSITPVPAATSATPPSAPTLTPASSMTRQATPTATVQKTNHVASVTSALPPSTAALTSTSASMASLAALNQLNNLNQLGLYNQWANLAAAAGYFQSLTAEQMRRLGGGLPASTPLIPSSLTVTQSSARPPPLVRTTATTPSTTTSATSRLQANSLNHTLRQLYGSSIDAATLSQFAAATANTQLTSALSAAYSQAQTQSHPTIKYTNASISATGKPVSKAPPPLIPVNGMRSSDNLSSHKGVGRNGLDKLRLVDVQPFRPDPTRSEPPYKVRKMNIDNKGVLCINHSSYKHQSTGDYNMVALQDVIKDFIPTKNLSECIEIFQNLLNITVYKANWHQVSALQSAWGASSPPEVVPLICATDLVTYLTQIKYLSQPSRTSSLAPQAKRIRTT